MINQDINEFIQKSRGNGDSDEVILSKLISNGWDKDEIKSALEGKEYIPVPKPNKPINDDSNEYRHLSHPLNSVGYLIMLITFVIMTVSINYVFVVFLNFYFPEQKSFGATLFSVTSIGEFLNTVAGFLAAAIISSPIFLLINAFSRNYEETYILIRRSFTRKFVVFSILIGTFVAMIYSVVSILFNIFVEKITLNNFLISMIIIVTCSIPFVYYLLQLKDDRKIAN